MGLHRFMTLMRELNNGMTKRLYVTSGCSSSLIVATSMPPNHLGDIDAARSASALIAIILQQLDKMDKSG